MLGPQGAAGVTWGRTPVLSLSGREPAPVKEQNSLQLSPFLTADFKLLLFCSDQKGKTCSHPASDPNRVSLEVQIPSPQRQES